MNVQKDLFDFTSPPQQVKVYSGSDSFFDIPAITTQLASIMFEQLKGNPALRHFYGSTETVIKLVWGDQAVQWLIDDLRADDEVFKYLDYRIEDGSKIVVGSAFKRDLFKLDIEFQNGVCDFEIMLFRLSEAIGKYYGIGEIFTSVQIHVGTKELAPYLVGAVRDKKYSYPYTDDTKTKLLGMAKYIKIAAGQMGGVSPLALAGAVADALDDDLEPRLQEAYALHERYWIEHVKRNADLYSVGVQLLIVVLFPPEAGVLLGTGDIPSTGWSIIEAAEAHDEMLVYFTQFLYRATNWLGHTIAATLAGIQDEAKDNSVALEIKSRIDPSQISDAEKEILRQKIKEHLIHTADQSLVLSLFALTDNKYSGKIIQNAKTIEQRLSGHEKEPAERDSVTKWERFYHDFR